MTNLRVLFFLLVCTYFTHAQSSFPDSSFNNTGILTHAVGTSDDKIWSVALQPDGKIVAAGHSYNTGGVMNFALSRYLTNGTPDITFSFDGILTDSVSTLGCGYHSVTVQPDGKIVAAGFGRYNGQDDFVISRTNDDGSPDTTFGIAGKVHTDFNGLHDDVFGVIIQPDGKIVAGGVASNLQNGDFAFARYNTDGSPDTTFSADGKLIISYPVGASFINALALQSDGKIIAGGYATTGNVSDFALARINSDGSVDSAFGTSGRVTTAITANDDKIYGLALQSDGKIVATGYAILLQPYPVFATARYLTNGIPDSTFNSDGILTNGFNGFIDISRAVVIDSSGKITTGGYSNSGLQNDFALARYNSDGTPDNTYGINGKLITAVSNSYDGIYSLLLQPDGKLVAGGFAQSGSAYQFALVRYLADLNLGVLDFLTNDKPIYIYPNPVLEEATLSYELKSEETISVLIVDQHGSVVKTIIDNSRQNPGRQHISFSLEKGLSRAYYFIQIKTSQGRKTIGFVH